MILRHLRFAAAAFLIAAAFVAPAFAGAQNPGIVTLGDFQVAAAATQTGTEVDNLQGMVGLSCQVRFFWGSGGSQTNVFVQTSLDQSQSWVDLANVQFTTSAGIEVFNLSGLNGITTPTAPTNLALTANTTFNGPMGDRLRAVVVSSGTYAGSTLASVRCSVR